MKYNILRSYQDLHPDEWHMVVKKYKSGYTARECATEFGIEFKQGFVTALAREHDKKASHGGARKGSGNLSAENREVKNLVDLIIEAKAISGLHTMPDPADINFDNLQEKRVETRNKINATIAALKKIAAMLGCFLVLYLLLK